MGQRRGAAEGPTVLDLSGHAELIPGRVRRDARAEPRLIRALTGCASSRSSLKSSNRGTEGRVTRPPMTKRLRFLIPLVYAGDRWRLTAQGPYVPIPTALSGARGPGPDLDRGDLAVREDVSKLSITGTVREQAMR